MTGVVATKSRSRNEAPTVIPKGADGTGDAKPAPTRTRKAGVNWTPWLFMAPAILYVVLFFAYPLFNNVVMSFQDYTTKTFYNGEAPWVGLKNYIEVFSSNVFSTSVVNTILFTVVSIAFQFALGLGLAVFFHKKFPLSGFIRGLFMLPWLLPIIASGAIWRWILDQDNGILNQFLKGIGVIDSPVPWLTSTSVALAAVIIVNIWLGIPFNMVLLYSGLEGIPDDLYEAASIDGASAWQKFRHITLPSLRPVIGVVLVLGVVYTLKAVDIILGLTGGGPANATQTLATAAYQESFKQFHFGTGAAMSNVLMLVALGFAFIYLRINRNED